MSSPQMIRTFGFCCGWACESPDRSAKHTSASALAMILYMHPPADFNVAPFESDYSNALAALFRKHELHLRPQLPVGAVVRMHIAVAAAILEKLWP